MIKKEIMSHEHERSSQEILDDEIFRNFQSSIHLCEGKAPHVFVVLGASGDLAKKKIYPTLW